MTILKRFGVSITLAGLAMTDPAVAMSVPSGTPVYSKPRADAAVLWTIATGMRLQLKGCTDRGWCLLDGTDPRGWIWLGMSVADEGSATGDGASKAGTTSGSEGGPSGPSDSSSGPIITTVAPVLANVNQTFGTKLNSGPPDGIATTPKKR